jgi:hypothetical protein
MDSKMRHALQQNGYRIITSYEALDDELLVLVRYWMKRYLNKEFFCFMTGCMSRSDNWALEIADSRIKDLQEVLGAEITTRAIREAEAMYKCFVGRRSWEIFLRGDLQECERFRHEIWEGNWRDESEPKQEVASNEESDGPEGLEQCRRYGGFEVPIDGD